MFGWYFRRRARVKALVRNVQEIYLEIKKISDMQGLDGTNVFSFPMLGKEVSMFLPYARFDFIQRNILANADFFEGELLRDIRQRYFTGQHCRVLDIGGNIGNHAVFFANFCNAEVITFEPQPAIFKILKKNIELNSSKVIAYNLALGDVEGFVSIGDYDSSNTGATSFHKTSNEDFKLCKLDSFDFNDISFIKIDVEGFEASVLRGGIATISKCKPILWIEIFSENFKEVNDILVELKYSLKQKLADNNYIFIPNEYREE